MTRSFPSRSLDVQDAARRLLDYCVENNWSGHDPYDALNSKLIGAIPGAGSRIPALVVTQLLKRSPVNLRRLLSVPKSQNPKAIALFLSALLQNRELAANKTGALVRELTELLVALRSTGTSYWCWGYSFPWQGRKVLVPRWAPNLVCTQFAATAILDLYEQTHESEYLEIAVSAGEFVLNELYWTGNDGEAGFSYPLPTVRNQVHNANFLGAALFCRLYKHTHKARFLDPALRVARYSAGKQRADGSWPYGEASSQTWIDNFHTGYNLCALQSISRDADTDEFSKCIQHGFEFYRANFFRKDGAAKYFHNQTYPLDIHCIAQSIITLLEFRDFNPENIGLANLVFQWAMRYMWDDRGFFYYRFTRLGPIRTSYMRWSQAWMLRALSELSLEANTKATSQEAEGKGDLLKV